MSVRGLGKDFDIGVGIVPVNLGTAANTGKRLHMKNYGGVAVVACFNNGTAAEAPTIVFQEHTAATSGTSRDLDVVTTYYKKEEAALDGDEAWTKVTQTAGDITNADWDDANQVLVVAQVDASSLSDDCEWISVNIADTGTAQVGGVIYVMYDLKVQRAPENLPNPNA
jgi:hypothetical protein